MKVATLFPTLAILGKSFFVLLTVEVFVHLLCIVTFQIVTRHTYKNIVASPIIFFCRVAVMDVKVGTFLPNDAGFVILKFLAQLLGKANAAV